MIKQFNNIYKKECILFVNLGTPDSYKPKDVKKYLKEFLSDPRIIDIPAIPRFLLLNLFILPFRPKKVSPKYEKIWQKDGSPLIIHTNKLKEELEKVLDKKYIVEFAMRYGNPSIDDVLEKIKNMNVNSIKIIPLFPQYSSANAGSINQKIMKIIQKWEIIPSIEFKNYFYDNPNFIYAWSEIGKQYLNNENYDHILFSFHGLPESHIKKLGYKKCLKENCCNAITEDNLYCYKAQCIQTAHLIAESLNLSKENYSISFQSRFGKTIWIEPYTEQTLKNLAKAGYKNILVFSPSFVTDCLETLYEIEIEYQDVFKFAGGNKLQLVQSLNSNPIWVRALEKIIQD